MLLHLQEPNSKEQAYITQLTVYKLLSMSANKAEGVEKQGTRAVDLTATVKSVVGIDLFSTLCMAMSSPWSPVSTTASIGVFETFGGLLRQSVDGRTNCRDEIGG